MSRRLQILQIFNRYLQYGGEEGSVFRIGDALQKFHDVEYFFTSTEQWAKDRDENAFLLLRDSLRNREVLARLRRYQRLGRFDFWLVHNVFPAISPVIYEEAFAQRIPIVHYLHSYRLFCVNGFFVNHGKPCMRCVSGNFFPAFATACWRGSRLRSGAFGLVLSRLRHLGLFERVAAWICLSERQKEIYADLGLPPERLHVVPHFFESREEPLPPSREPVLLFVGRLSAEKGVLHLLRAWERIKTRGARLIIAGDGPERGNLGVEAARRRLKNVTFTGFVKREEQASLWRQAMASVVPSIWEEPFGMVVLEAWARGRAVIAHRIGSLPELVEPGVTGLLAAPFDPDSLAGAIDQAFGNPEVTAEMGRRGHASLATRFSEQRWFERIVSVFESLPAK